MSDEEKPKETEEEPKKEPPKANWEYKQEFGIVKQMREVTLLTKQATEMEIGALQRKLEKLTYGS